jgi:hypothetical protein
VTAFPYKKPSSARIFECAPLTVGPLLPAEETAQSDLPGSFPHGPLVLQPLSDHILVAATRPGLQAPPVAELKEILVV